MSTTYTAPTQVMFARPSGLTVNAANWSDNTAAYLTSGSTDMGIFKLNSLRETGPIGVRYLITDPYHQTAYQCLKLHAEYFCDSAIAGASACTCSYTPPYDPAFLLWTGIGASESCP